MAILSGKIFLTRIEKFANGRIGVGRRWRYHIVSAGFDASAHHVDRVK